MWDLGSNQTIQVAGHDAPVKVVRWVKAPNYTALMSCSWDKTVKFWDTRYYFESNLKKNCIITVNILLVVLDEYHQQWSRLAD
jgi:WD40 repeat protein